MSAPSRFALVLVLLLGLSHAATRDKSQTQLSRMLTASGGAAGDRFGSSVDMEWDTSTAVVGAEMASTSNGAAYVFYANYDSANAALGNTVVGFWGQKKTLVAGDPAAGDRFGASVAVAGDSILVGAPAKGSNGAAYFFGRNNGGVDNWNQVTKVVPTGSYVATNSFFGASVDMSPNYAVVGCPRCTATPHLAAGAAFVYALVGGTWSSTPVAILTAGDSRSSAQFGNAVSLTDDDVVVGAFQDRGTTPPQFNYYTTGSVYVFSRGSLWTQYRKLTAPTADLANGLMFGISVSVRVDSIMVEAFSTKKFYLYTRTDSDDWALSTSAWSPSSTDQSTTGMAFAGQPISSDGQHAIVGDMSYSGNGAAFIVPHGLVCVGPAAQIVTPQARHTMFYQ